MEVFRADVGLNESFVTTSYQVDWVTGGQRVEKTSDPQRVEGILRRGRLRLGRLEVRH